MQFINPPEKAPEHIIHRTFFSKLYDHEIGYNIYLPPNYETSGERYPAMYHLHGWMGNETSEIWPLEKVYKNRRAIAVFPNSSPVIGDREDYPVESMLFSELMPHINAEYRTDTSRESTSISGFSMGGGMAFCFALRHLDRFSLVTAYAGTYHHYYHKGSQTVGAAPDQAAKLYDEMIREKRHFEEGNILCLVRQSADQIRGQLKIALHVGTEDVLFCDNEILHLYLCSLDIPHEYKKFEGAAHELSKIVLG